MSWQYFTHCGEHGCLELLPLGTVERECEEKGERIYQLSDLGELLAEIKASKVPVTQAPATDTEYDPATSAWPEGF